MPTAAVMSWNGVKLEPFYRPDLAILIDVKLPASVNLARGTVLGEVTATPGTFKAYANGNSDGSETAKAILAFDVSTDAGGLITLTGTSGQGGDELGSKLQAVPAYVAGYFAASELTGLDANGLVDLGGNLVSGSLSDGVVRLG